MAYGQALYFEGQAIWTAIEHLSLLYPGSRVSLRVPLARDSPSLAHLLTRATRAWLFTIILQMSSLLAGYITWCVKIPFPTGRGTSMLDGLSIAWAVIEYLHSKINCRTLASTHYYQLAKLADSLPRVDCYHVTAKNSEEGISFTFKVLVSISVLLRFSVSRDRDHFGHMT